eukprot:4177289-Pleurochrysis_carterae.AAC.1
MSNTSDTNDVIWKHNADEFNEEAAKRNIPNLPKSAGSLTSTCARQTHGKSLPTCQAVIDAIRSAACSLHPCLHASISMDCTSTPTTLIFSFLIRFSRELAFFRVTAKKQQMAASYGASRDALDAIGT